MKVSLVTSDSNIFIHHHLSQGLNNISPSVCFHATSYTGMCTCMYTYVCTSCVRMHTCTYMCMYVCTYMYVSVTQNIQFCVLYLWYLPENRWIRLDFSYFPSLNFFFQVWTPVAVCSAFSHALQLVYYYCLCTISLPENSTMFILKAAAELGQLLTICFIAMVIVNPRGHINPSHYLHLQITIIQMFYALGALVDPKSWPKF